VTDPSPGRPTSSANTTALQARVVRAVLLADLEFASGTLNLTNAPFNIVVGGVTYQGVGQFGGTSPVEEGIELQAYNLALQLNGIPTALLAIALGEDYQGRSCTVSLLLLDEGHRPIDDAIVLFRGRMDVMRITAGETGTIELTAESRLADWERPRVRRYTNADQQLRFAGDKGLEFVSQMAEKEIIWPDSKFFK